MSLFEKIEAVLEETFIVGKPFLGAYGVADIFDKDRGSILWGVVMRHAFAHFDSFHIFTDAEGVLTKIERK